MKLFTLDPGIINSIGLLFDIIGFVLISFEILKQKAPSESETTTFTDLAGNVIAENLTSIDYLKSSKWAKLGFFLIILGFMFQIAGNLSVENPKEITTDLPPKKHNVGSNPDVIKEIDIPLEVNYITTENLNLRKDARVLENNIVQVLQKGEIVKLIEKRDHWWFVEYNCNSTCNSKFGFTHSDYLVPSRKIN